MSTLLLLLALGVGETSRHNDILLPYDEAVERCHKQGMDWERVQPKVTQSRETEDKTVLTKVVIVTCKRPVIDDTEAPATVSVQVSWSAPEFRENGDALALNEIGYYEIHLNGEIHTAQDSPWRIDLVPGSYSVSMLVYAVDGLRSDMTSSVEFEVKGE